MPPTLVRGILRLHAATLRDTLRVHKFMERQGRDSLFVGIDVIFFLKCFIANLNISEVLRWLCKICNVENIDI